MRYLKKKKRKELASCADAAAESSAVLILKLCLLRYSQAINVNLEPAAT